MTVINPQPCVVSDTNFWHCVLQPAAWEEPYLPKRNSWAETEMYPASCLEERKPESEVEGAEEETESGEEGRREIIHKGRSGTR